jgi:hypothetical protein
MSIKTLPNFATISEFISSLNGDCGPTATLSALNHVNPEKWPLTAAGLKALDADEIAHGFAEANGAQNVPSMDGYLTKIGIAHHTVSYAGFTFAELHTALKAYAAEYPVIVEWSLAGKLPGDEPAVQFHYSTCGGINTGPKDDGAGGGYLWCDGDNSGDDSTGKPRPPILYTIQQVQAAAPVGYIIVTQPPVGAPKPTPTPAPVPTPTPTPVPVDYQAKYNTLKAAITAALEAN